MNIIDKIKIKRKEKQYKDYIQEHKNNVKIAYNTLISCPDLAYIFLDEELDYILCERIKHHDDSKYSEEEFDAYRKYFYPIDEMEKLSCINNFNKAWEHHWKNNDHHWQNRQNNEIEEVSYKNKEYQAAILENICDWMAMGIKFGDTAWEYYEKNKNKIILPQKDREFLEEVLYKLKNSNIGYTVYHVL